MSTTHLPSLFFLYSCSLLISHSLAANVRCNPNDYEVLMKIKKSLNNPYHLASWVPNTDCCNWYVVECDAKTNRITELTIFSGQISGRIPPSVGDLPYLETLIFRKLTNLTGSIPQSIVKLKYLKMLRLSWTNLSGPIPNFLNRLSNLEYLDLSFNQFSGSIPPNLSDLKNLGTLHLDRNRLTGSIPESFGRFIGSVTYLYLSHNQISGQIPKSLGEMDFVVIDLSRNRLEGDASMFFNPNHTSTRSIDMSRNQLEFDLTKVNRLPTSLVSLDISHNKIFGRIPELMKGLDFLNVSYNRLCGEIPTGGKLQGFENTSFFHNRCLCGPPLTTMCR